MISQIKFLIATQTIPQIFFCLKTFLRQSLSHCFMATKAIPGIYFIRAEFAQSKRTFDNYQPVLINYKQNSYKYKHLSARFLNADRRN